MIFEPFTVVRVPFPFTDHRAVKSRPALVRLDAEAFGNPVGLSVPGRTPLPAALHAGGGEAGGSP